MKTDEPNRIISFAEFELDTVRRRLTREGETVALHARAFDLLSFLIQNNGRLVTKDEIFSAVWDRQFVEEANLIVQISNLRKVLGETKNAPRFLVTIPGKGYKFAAETNDNLLTIETHSVSELTIEEEIIPQRRILSAKTNQKWIAVSAIAILTILTVGAIGYFSFRQVDEKNDFASIWTNPSRRVSPRQLTANGKIGVSAISPDGNLFAYTNEGSEKSGLWVSGITGTQTFEVLPPTAINILGLTFSPDGLQIYYAARDEKNPNGALFRVPAFGGLSEKILSNVNRPVTFSPDGKQFAFVRVDSQRTAIITANSSGNTEEKEIAVRPKVYGFNDNGASWSPDGTKIAVSGKDETTSENTVLLVDVASGSAETFGEKAWTWVRRVEWMPDGSSLFLNVIEKDSLQERQIWMVEYPSGKAHKITNDLNRYGGETVSISKDGTKLIGVSAQTISNIFVGNSDDIARLDKITNNAVGKRDGAFNGLTFAPDGRLVFRRFFDKSETLWTMNSDGSNAKQLTPGGSVDRKPSVTNDGRFVGFDSRRSGNWNIWRINSDGSDLKQITTDGGYGASVTPDGNWIFYEVGGLIWRISPDGGTPVQITNKASKSVEISPDGKMFACFYRPIKEEKLKLAVFPIEGGEPLYLFDSALDLNYEKLRWSPDGKSLIYAFYNSTAWKQNLAGGTPEKFLEFADEIINAFAWSSDGKKFAVAHGQELRDVVLFTIEK
ncbi:MAG TPA: winged helix-turn-helix domain-containing protein [Pyrinomonadaceae bacterium]|mgnify:CR=1 FL=1|nr:winged helix-turn-helix domain-containing protein [Pyrinomonadaceae bacterium]